MTFYYRGYLTAILYMTYAGDNVSNSKGMTSQGSHRL